MAQLPLKLPLDQMQSKWKSILDPVLAQAILSGVALSSVSLAIGNNTINHTLGRTPQGYLVTRYIGGFTQIYDLQSTNPRPELTLILNSSAVATVDLMVY